MLNDIRAKSTHRSRRRMRGESRRELAQRYFPDSKGRLAVARLRRWIEGDPQMLRDLLEVGYRPHVHSLSEAVVEVLDRYLG